MKNVIAIFGILFVWASLASAQSDPSKLAQDAREQLELAHRSLNDAERAGDRVAALSQTIRAYEDGMNALREGLRHAALREAAIQKEFEAESEQVSQFLGVLLNIQSSAGPLVLLHPAGPLGTARSGMIVSEVTPALQNQAEALRRKLEEVALLRALQESAADSLQKGLEGVQQARTELSLAISNRTDLPIRFLSDPEQLQSMIESAETLDGFASGLSSINIGTDLEDPIQDFQAAKGTLPLPVAGTLLRRFYEPDSVGIKRTGILFATRPLAIVTVPWPSTLRYRGPLLDYGKVIIIEPEANVLMVFAGLEEVYGEVGEVLTPGTALGLMGGAAADPGTFLLNATNGSGSEQTETLYIELRIGDTPVNPAEWFAETRE